MNKSVSGIKNKNRSIRDIDKKGANTAPENTKPSGASENDSDPPRQSRNQTAATVGMWLIGFIVILLIFFLFSVIFAQTTVTVTPRTAPVSIDNTYSVLPTSSATSSPDKLTYSITTADKTVSQITESSSVDYREARASGRITIYNNFSNDSLRLVDNTRFQAPNGNIYRSQKPVTVPGKQGGQPGTVTIEVVADKPGKTYNITENTQFSVPGLAGTPQEEDVYARLQSPINGGIAREVPAVSTSTRKRIITSLKDGLKRSLVRQTRGMISKDQTIYDSGVFFNTDTTIIQGENNQATIKVTGKVHAVTFNNRELAIFLAQRSGIDVSADTNITLKDPHDFSVDLVDKNNFDPVKPSPLQVSLKGNSSVVWQYNKQALARDLQGLQKSQVTEVLDNYKSIQEARINTRPFWKRSLPANPEEITITTSSI